MKRRDTVATAAPPVLIWTALVGVCCSMPGTAVCAQWDFDNGWKVNFDSTVSIGAALRTSGTKCEYVGNDNGGCVGAQVTPLQKHDPTNFAQSIDVLRLNQDDGNLNYGAGDLVSTNAQWLIDFAVKATHGWSALVRGTINYDFSIDNTDRTKLDSAAKGFAVSNPRLLDAYVSKEFNVGNDLARIRVGNQVLSWGEDIFIPGGINSINTLYLPASHSPGTPLKSLFNPAPMVSIGSALGRGLGFEAFYQWHWNSIVFDAPGTFFSTSDLVGKGGRGIYFPTSAVNAVMPPDMQLPYGWIGDTGTHIVGIDPQTGLPYNRRLKFNELSDPATNPVGPIFGTGSVIPRTHSNTPSDRGQGGVTFRYTFEESSNELGFYYYNYSDKIPFASYRLVETTSNPFGWQTFLDYGTNRNLFGASYNFQVTDWVIGTELSYRPKDAVAIDPTAVVNPENRYYCNGLGDPEYWFANIGKVCRGSIDTANYQFHLTGLNIFAPSGSMGWLLRGLHATEGTVTAETAVAYYPQLNFHNGIPYAVTSNYALPTRTSWGMVFSTTVTYPNIFGSRVSFLPDLSVSQGLSGYSATALPGFVQGAGAATLGFNFDFKTKPDVKLRLDATQNWGGGASNLLRDRNWMSISVTTSF